MNKIKFVAALALMPMMLAACGGNNPTVSSSEVTPSSSEAPASTISSSHVHNETFATQIRTYGESRVIEVTAGSSYKYVERSSFHFTLTFEKNNATSDIVPGSDHLLMPAGSKITLTLTTAGEYLLDSYSVDSQNTVYSGPGFLVEEGVASVTPSDLTIDNAVATASTAETNKLNLAYNSKTCTSVSIVPNIDVKLRSLGIVYNVVEAE